MLDHVIRAIADRIAREAAELDAGHEVGAWVEAAAVLDRLADVRGKLAGQAGTTTLAASVSPPAPMPGANEGGGAAESGAATPPQPAGAGSTPAPPAQPEVADSDDPFAGLI